MQSLKYVGMIQKQTNTNCTGVWIWESQLQVLTLTPTLPARDAAEAGARWWSEAEFRKVQVTYQNSCTTRERAPPITPGLVGRGGCLDVPSGCSFISLTAPQCGRAGFHPPSAQSCDHADKQCIRDVRCALLWLTVFLLALMTGFNNLGCCSRAEGAHEIVRSARI